MIGPIVNSSALALGGIIGVLAGPKLPLRIKTTLPLIFGVITIGIGIQLIPRLTHLPVIVLALILGTIIGELCYVELGLEKSIRFLLRLSKKHNKPIDDNSIIQTVTLISVFCFSSMGVFAAITEGATGKPDLLLTKAVLDFFTGVIFGATLGLQVCFIAIPQFITLSVLYISGSILMPYLTPTVISNFTATGGIILLGTGLRLCGIKIFPVINMMPALILAILLTPLWIRLMG